MMTLYAVTIIFGITCLPIASYGLPIEDKNDAVLYLKKFGYLEEPTGQKTLAIRGQEEVSNAIKDFQTFAGLNETGELDNETISKMNVPRCGVKDKIRHSARMKRYALQGSKWHKKELTYRISKYSTRIPDKKITRTEIARAFKIWSNVTTLNFKEKLRGPVDIDIRFEVRNHGDGDGNKFDGPGGVLAHAFFPKYGGYIHFDDEEKWTINEESGINLFQVAAHEIGHSLGLRHSKEEGAIMGPYYHKYIPGFQLHTDDIEAIQAIYGSRNKPLPPDDKNDVNTEPPTYTGNAPNLCSDATIDTITRTKKGSTYAFKGDLYWKVHLHGVSKGYPRNISDDWHGLEGNLDASFTTSNGRTFFFKGRRYWRFTNKKMVSGYPKLISAGFKGIPDNLDAALVWGANDKIYFFKGDEYWRYEMDAVPPVSQGYPARIIAWSGLLAGGIDAAFQWENKATYFFKGYKYYRYNDKTSEVEKDPPYPLSTATEWFGCRAAHNYSTKQHRHLPGLQNQNRIQR